MAHYLLGVTFAKYLFESKQFCPFKNIIGQGTLSFVAFFNNTSSFNNIERGQFT